MRRLAPTDLTRVALVLSPGRARHGWLAWGALVLIAGAAGAAGSSYYWMQRVDPLQQQAAASKDVPVLQRALEQSRLQLRVSDARSTELERQIDVLNQKLRESQEEVTFFRKTRDAKHTTP